MSKPPNLKSNFMANDCDPNSFSMNDGIERQNQRYIFSNLEYQDLIIAINDLLKVKIDYHLVKSPSNIKTEVENLKLFISHLKQLTFENFMDLNNRISHFSSLILPKSRNFKQFSKYGPLFKNYIIECISINSILKKNYYIFPFIFRILFQWKEGIVINNELEFMVFINLYKSNEIFKIFKKVSILKDAFGFLRVLIINGAEYFNEESCRVVNSFLNSCLDSGSELKLRNALNIYGVFIPLKKCRNCIERIDFLNKIISIFQKIDLSKNVFSTDLKLLIACFHVIRLVLSETSQNISLNFVYKSIGKTVLSCCFYGYRNGTNYNLVSGSDSYESSDYDSNIRGSSDIGTKIRLNSLRLLATLSRIFPLLVFADWKFILPCHTNDSNDSLLSILYKEESFKMRMEIIATLSSLFENGKIYTSIAVENEIIKPRGFVPRSQTVGRMIGEILSQLLQLLSYFAKLDNQSCIKLLSVESLLLTYINFEKLNPFKVSKCISILDGFLEIDNIELRIATLKCLSSAFGTISRLPEVIKELEGFKEEDNNIMKLILITLGDSNSNSMLKPIFSMLNSIATNYPKEFLSYIWIRISDIFYTRINNLEHKNSKIIVSSILNLLNCLFRNLLKTNANYTFYQSIFEENFKIVLDNLKNFNDLSSLWVSLLSYVPEEVYLNFLKFKSIPWLCIELTKDISNSTREASITAIGNFCTWGCFKSDDYLLSVCDCVKNIIIESEKEKVRVKEKEKELLNLKNKAFITMVNLVQYMDTSNPSLHKKIPDLLNISIEGSNSSNEKIKINSLRALGYLSKLDLIPLEKILIIFLKILDEKVSQKLIWNLCFSFTCVFENRETINNSTLDKLNILIEKFSDILKNNNNFKVRIAVIQTINKIPIPIKYKITQNLIESIVYVLENPSINQTGKLISRYEESLLDNGKKFLFYLLKEYSINEIKDCNDFLFEKQMFIQKSMNELRLKEKTSFVQKFVNSSDNTGVMFNKDSFGPNSLPSEYKRVDETLLSIEIDKILSTIYKKDQD